MAEEGNLQLREVGKEGMMLERVERKTESSQRLKLGLLELLA